MWHKHHEQQPEEASELYDENKIREAGKNFAKDLLAREEERLGRKLTFEEKKALAKKTVGKLLDNLTIKPSDEE